MLMEGHNDPLACHSVNTIMYATVYGSDEMCEPSASWRLRGHLIPTEQLCRLMSTEVARFV
jgi:hypothetical protein